MKDIQLRVFDLSGLDNIVKSRLSDIAAVKSRKFEKNQGMTGNFWVADLCQS